MSDTKVDISKLSKEQATNYMIQKMIDDYLKINESPAMKEILAKVGKVEIVGELTPEHNMILQAMVKDYYDAEGKSLDEDLKAANVEFKDGILSKVELDCVDRLLRDYCDSLNDYLQAVLKDVMVV